MDKIIPKHITRQMKIFTDLFDNILGKNVVESQGTTLKINLEKETDNDRLLELELKETVVLNVLYNMYNCEVKSENIGFCITAEDDMWGEIDLAPYL